ncbi:YdcH family protein [Methylocystis sp. JAN1]|uniref:YdcH family protein n=1 Tax=Methylocystis sp. JAN1 TaxID=3397211 RepID=UPI003FA2E576
MNDNPSDAEQDAIRVELERLRLEHQDLEAAIDALIAVGAPDQLQIQRLKKRKLLLRDRIAQLEDQLTPDIIA